jgi:hypothetical protein
MENANQSTTSEAAQTNTSRPPDLHGLFLFFTFVFMVTSIIFIYFGLTRSYSTDYSSRIVGGDAYNYIIYATRGTALVCAGVACAVLSATFTLLAINTSIRK